MEPLFKSLIVQLAPRPRQMPPAPLDHDDLQMIFSEVRRIYPYQVFQFTPDQRGAVFQNGPDDAVEVRPAQLQIMAKLDGPEPLTADSAEKKVMTILKAATTRLEMEEFLQCAIQVIALGAVPGDDAKRFVSETLMADVAEASKLGRGYFGGGIRFRRILDNGEGEDSIAVEPFLENNAFLYLQYDRARMAVTDPISLDQVSTWIGEAFEFLKGPTMTLLTT